MPSPRGMPLTPIAPRADVRQILESSRSLEVKYKGNLNTVSGEYQYRGHVKKLFYSNTPSLAR